MAQLKAFALLICCLSLASCGGFTFVGFVSNPGGTSSVSGVVSAVQNGFFSNSMDSMSQFTQVTFLTSVNAITLNFCGDQTQWFPLNQQVQAEFTAGVSCNVLVKVVVANDLGVHID
jgi:hypothetical protein